MTYRASLGTRGELRRIAAEAENVTIDRVRPWIRKTQHCRLAPHVIVPQWTRLEHPLKPKPPPPLVSNARIVAGELIEEILESATAKKFRRGRGTRGRPRKRTEGNLNPDLASAKTGDKAAGAAVSKNETTSEALGTVTGSTEEPQNAGAPNANQKSEMDIEKPGETIGKDDEKLKADNKSDQGVEKAQSGAKEGPAEGAKEGPAEGAKEGPAEGAKERPAEGAKERPAEGAKERPPEGAKKRPPEGAKKRPPEGAKKRPPEGAKEGPTGGAKEGSKEGSKVDNQSTGGERLEEPELGNPVQKESAPGQDVQMRAAPEVGEKPTEEGNINKDVEMTEVPPVSKETSA